MRSPAFLSLLLLGCFAAQADARLFWQTYGSVVPTPEGGCTWNANSDYFVPRYCSTCRYGLYSPCKRDCTSSPACRRCHAHYPGYCSPYGCFHYCWRNHVYARKCGCCPVAYNGPYRAGCGPCLCEQGCPPGCLAVMFCARPYCCRQGVCGGCQGGMCQGDVMNYHVAMAPTDGCYDGQCPNIQCPNIQCPNIQCPNNQCPNNQCPDGNCEYLPNIESSEYQVLGAISLSGDPLLSSLQLGAGMPLLPGQVQPQAGPTVLENPLQHILPKAQIDPQTPIDGNPAAPEYIPSGNDMIPQGTLPANNH